jgi:hypothetical protein
MELSGVFVNLMNQIFSHKSATGQSYGMKASDFEKDGCTFDNYPQ